MQDKIALEEHFALPETLDASRAVRGRRIVERSAPPSPGSGRSSTGRDGSTRDRVRDPLAQRARHSVDSRPRSGDCHVAARQRSVGGRRSRTAGPVRGFRGAADAESGRGGGGTDALRDPAWLQRRSGQRLFRCRSVRPGRLLRRPGLRSVLGGRRTAERAVLSASARSPAGSGTDLRRPSVAARSGVGIRRRNRRACAAPDEQRPLRPSSAAHHRPRPPGRRSAVQHLARRSPSRQVVARDAGAAEAGGLSPLEFLSHDERQFSYADTRQRDGGGRPGSAAVLGRLPVRGPRGCGDVV